MQCSCMVVICQHNTDTKETKETKENTQLRTMVHNCVKNLFTPTLDKEPIEKVLRKKIPYEPLQFIRDSVRLKYVILIISLL